MPSVNLSLYSLNRPFEWVPTQNANNVEDSPTGRRMGVNRDFTAWEFWDWLHFPPAVFAETRRPRSSYRFAYGRRASAAAAIGKRSYHGHWGPDHTSTGQKQPRHPPIVLGLDTVGGGTMKRHSTRTYAASLHKVDQRYERRKRPACTARLRAFRYLDRLLTPPSCRVTARRRLREHSRASAKP